MRLYICECNDNRVAEAIRRCPQDLGIKIYPIHTRRVQGGAGSHDPYKAGIHALRRGAVDSIAAGATIALSEFLPLVFDILKTSRKEHPLFAAAPIEPIKADPFLLVDPCALISPEPKELSEMAVCAAKLYSAIYARDDPFVSILSHATGDYHLHKDRHATAVVKALKDSQQVQFSEAILQVDAALSLDAARIKAARMHMRPNILVCPNIDMANAIYKTLEVFGRKTTRLSGAILTDLNKIFIGLLPRTCTTEEVLRLFSNLTRAVRGLRTS